jgi:hypothetical protein
LLSWWCRHPLKTPHHLVATFPSCKRNNKKTLWFNHQGVHSQTFGSPFEPRKFYCFLRFSFENGPILMKFLHSEVLPYVLFQQEGEEYLWPCWSRVSPTPCTPGRVRKGRTRSGRSSPSKVILASCIACALRSAGTTIQPLTTYCWKQIIQCAIHEACCKQAREWAKETDSFYACIYQKDEDKIFHRKD